MIQQAIAQQLTLIFDGQFSDNSYADDNQIYVKSKKAAERVMLNVTSFIEDKLKLKVNRRKSAIGRPWQVKFLGFSFYRTKGGVRVRVHPKSIRKIKEKIKAITSRSNACQLFRHS